MSIHNYGCDSNLYQEIEKTLNDSKLSSYFNIEYLNDRLIITAYEDNVFNRIQEIIARVLSNSIELAYVNEEVAQSGAKIIKIEQPFLKINSKACMGEESIAINQIDIYQYVLNSQYEFARNFLEIFRSLSGKFRNFHLFSKQTG